MDKPTAPTQTNGPQNDTFPKGTHAMAALPAWQEELRRHVTECALTAALELEKMEIPKGKQAEYATGFAEEAISKVSDKIAARLQKTAKSDLDFIQKTTKSIKISPAKLLAYATRISGISDSKKSDKCSTPDTQRAEEVKKSPKTDNPPKRQGEPVKIGL